MENWKISMEGDLEEMKRSEEKMKKQIKKMKEMEQFYSDMKEADEAENRERIVDI